MKEKDRNLAASVKQRLLNLAVCEGVDFNLMQVRYGTERLLYRLSVSKYADSFFLKGAMLFTLWEKQLHRPTRDMDLLFLEQHDQQELENIFREIITNDVQPDGLIFDSDSIKADDIRENNAYGGIRIKLLAYLGSARIPLQVDIGLGDAVHPAPKWTHFETILDFPAPRIRPYPIYSVVAEKFQAMAELASSNSRMKDYFDIFYLQQRFDFVGQDLQQAIRKTFIRRKTDLPTVLIKGLDREFWSIPQKQKQWEAFLRKNSITLEPSLEKVCAKIADFVLPATQEKPFTLNWTSGKGWHA